MKFGGLSERKPRDQTPKLGFVDFFLSVIFLRIKTIPWDENHHETPSIHGEYVWNLFQAPTFATLSNALGGISRLAVALPEDDTLEVWSSCDSWFVGFVFEKEGSQETSSPTESIA